MKLEKYYKFKVSECLELQIDPTYQRIRIEYDRDSLWGSSSIMLSFEDFNKIIQALKTIEITDKEVIIKEQPKNQLNKVVKSMKNWNKTKFYERGGE